MARKRKLKYDTDRTVIECAGQADFVGLCAANPDTGSGAAKENEIAGLPAVTEDSPENREAKMAPEKPRNSPEKNSKSPTAAKEKKTSAAYRAQLHSSELTTRIEFRVQRNLKSFAEAQCGPGKRYRTLQALFADVFLAGIRVRFGKEYSASNKTKTQHPTNSLGNQP